MIGHGKQQGSKRKQKGGKGRNVKRVNQEVRKGLTVNLQKKSIGSLIDFGIYMGCCRTAEFNSKDLLSVPSTGQTRETQQRKQKAQLSHCLRAFLFFHGEELRRWLKCSFSG